LTDKFDGHLTKYNFSYSIIIFRYKNFSLLETSTTNNLTEKFNLFFKLYDNLKMYG